MEYLLENLGLSNSREVFPLYIGDDRTDEDAFEVLVYSLNHDVLLSTLISSALARFPSMIEC